MRLDKFLGNHGFGTRKEVKLLVKRGAVKVNDVVVKKSDIKIVPENDTVTVYDEVVMYEPFVYIMLNKPAGYISSTKDYKDETVLELIEGFEHYDLHPVGRLDKDTEGLLILTNDGQFSHDVLSPRKHVNKTYFARVDGYVTDDTVELFKAGITLDDGYKAMPAELQIISAGEISEIELVIQEGKFHQVKRMFKAVDMTVIYLKRIKMGGLPLDESLTPGAYRKLTLEEINFVKM
ncbi:pseudouridine synthase [Macrococcoides caseolyticum]|uniref:Pseudouridine synthase n=1 Tax=Macrococcoides caseolyticum TaxID=69966 RepID=A0A855GJ43_9STAP|nr:pseudouridine synthase [Macrococcus caseolyticus]PKE21569.1 16S rRNA pseudouridine(516) synthase [Macrococcus caseolyticus]PKE25929.1 16S rRNA pseudouridine(516) synthase [Macrococcus caseolyticus]PKE34159.1 16S rRNA pseudouridine(516) synthase [Macrococcus caseolyticus]PKE50607.1 16S rRNA pseudouridine(516) synthase [Macrococcus caseolyticus]PKE58441.1 16S rRNA pseudouridine(516) synthase [Macrococcus caseolyticus]